MYHFCISLDGDAIFSVEWDSVSRVYRFAPFSFSHDDLLVTASETSRIEEKHPDLLKRVTAHVNADILTEADTRQLDDILSNPPGSKILDRWQAVADFVKCSLSTAKRNYGGAVRRTNAGGIITTTAAIDQHRLKTALKKTPKKKRWRGAK